MLDFTTNRLNFEIIIYNESASRGSWFRNKFKYVGGLFFRLRVEIAIKVFLYNAIECRIVFSLRDVTRRQILKRRISPIASENLILN